MHKPPNNFHLLFSLLILLFSPPSIADVGTTTFYKAPYLPTVCFGSGSTRFPPNNLFAAAGEGVWDNGASCGREYLVRCLSSATRRACIHDGPTIQVTIVDQASMHNLTSPVYGTALVLSETAFRMIANTSIAIGVNIEFTAYDIIGLYALSVILLLTAIISIVRLTPCIL